MDWGSVDQKKLLILMVDNYPNIHTKHRPQVLNPTQISKKATLLLKRFDIPAISSVGLPTANNPAGVDRDLISRYLEEHASSLSKTYAQVMPNWIRANFFDAENERQRLVIHNYQDHG